MAVSLTFCDGSSSGSGAKNTPAKGVTIFAGGRNNTPEDGVGTKAGLGPLCYMTLIGDKLYVMDRDIMTLRSIDTNTALVHTPIVGIPPKDSRIGYPPGARGSYRDGPGTGRARFNRSCGMAAKASNPNTLYVADTENNRIRKIQLGDGPPVSSMVTTAAGTTDSRGRGGSADGLVTTAKFYHPQDVAISGNTIYVTDKVGIRTIDIPTREVGDFNAKLNLGDISRGDIAVNETGTTLYVFGTGAVARGGAKTSFYQIYAIDIATKEARLITDKVPGGKGIAVSGNTIYVSTSDASQGFIYRIVE